MAICEFCGTQTGAVGGCPNCGTKVYSAIGKVIYGPTANDMSFCAIHMTDRYIILCRMSKGEVNAKRYSGAFGLVGVLAAEVATDKKRSCGYYPYSDIAKGIFPYRANGIKKKDAIKLIRKDGAELILIVDQPGFVDSVWKALKKSVDAIKAKVPVENGENQYYGDVLCQMPWATAENFDRLKPSAEQQKSAVQTPPPAPVQPKAKVPDLPKCPACGEQLVENSAFCDYCGKRLVPQAETKSKTEIQPKAQSECICSACGSPLVQGSRFCDQCGTRVVEPQEQLAKAVPVCKSCGAKLSTKSKFCDQCGIRIEPEKTAFDVILLDGGDAKLDVLEVICDRTQLSLKEAKTVIQGCPGVVKTALGKEEAQALADALQAVGATVEIM